MRMSRFLDHQVGSVNSYLQFFTPVSMVMKHFSLMHLSLFLPCFSHNIYTLSSSPNLCLSLFSPLGLGVGRAQRAVGTGIPTLVLLFRWKTEQLSVINWK